MNIQADDLCEEVIIVLRKILRAISMQSKQLARACGITTPQLLVIRALGTKGELTVGALSKQVNLSQATVTAIVDRLERKGIVQRARSSIDRRKVHVRLSSEGREILSQAPSPIQESFSLSFRNLEPWEQTLILSSLQRVAMMMDASDLPAAPLLIEESQILGDPPDGSFEGL